MSLPGRTGTFINVAEIQRAQQQKASLQAQQQANPQQQLHHDIQPQYQQAVPQPPQHKHSRPLPPSSGSFQQPPQQLTFQKGISSQASFQQQQPPPPKHQFYQAPPQPSQQHQNIYPSSPSQQTSYSNPQSPIEQQQSFLPQSSLPYNQHSPSQPHPHPHPSQQQNLYQQSPPQSPYKQSPPLKHQSLNQRPSSPQSQSSYKQPPLPLQQNFYQQPSPPQQDSLPSPQSQSSPYSLQSQQQQAQSAQVHVPPIPPHVPPPELQLPPQSPPASNPPTSSNPNNSEKRSSSPHSLPNRPGGQHRLSGSNMRQTSNNVQQREATTLRRRNVTRHRESVNPQAAYEWALRCAIIASLDGARAIATAEAAVADRSKKDHRASVAPFDDVLKPMSDIFKESKEDKSSDKLTREIVKGLSRRVEDVISRKTVNTAYQDPQLISSLSAFLKVNLKDHKARPHGTINDLVIDFLRTSQGELRNANVPLTELADRLNNEVRAFVGLLKETLLQDAPSLATPETMERLDYMYGGGKKNAASSNKPSTTSASPATSLDTAASLEMQPLVQTVQKIFQVLPSQHSKIVAQLAETCTDQAYLTDLKRCIDNIYRNAPFPGNRSDFLEEYAYNAWKDRELKQLSGLLKTLTLQNPQVLAQVSSTEVQSLLSGPAPRPLSADMTRGSSSSGKRLSYTGDGFDVRDMMDEKSGSPKESSTGSFTFIPSDPKAFYRALFNACIDYETKIRPPEERSKTKILSPLSEDVLKECAVTWRISSTYRAILFLDCVKQRYEHEELEFEDLKEALTLLNKTMKDVDVNDWTLSDREFLARVYEGLNNSVLRELAIALGDYHKIKPEWVNDLLGILDRIFENPVFREQHPEIEGFFGEIEVAIEGGAVTRYYEIDNKIPRTRDDELTPLEALTDKLLKEINIIVKRYPQPIHSRISVPGIVLAKQMPYFTLELGNWANSEGSDDAPIDATFDLYHKVLLLKDLYQKFCPNQKLVAKFNVESWFLKHVRKWLKITDSKTPEWVQSAIVQDEFKRINEETAHSSSIVDLFSVFHQTIDFMNKLKWPNALQNARFMTTLSKIVCKALDQYCGSIEQQFMQDMFPEPVKSASAPTSKFSLNYVELKKSFLGGEKDVLDQPFDFKEESCIKLNDIEAAKTRLDRLYRTMEVDKVANLMHENAPPVPEKTENLRYLYSIKIVQGQNIKPMDNNGLSDPYCQLFIDQQVVARTRTAFETLNPRWDQVFDISLDNKPVEVLLVVMDADVLGADDDCGGVWFKLSPKFFSDYQSHDIWLDLDTQGRVLLRISMEGEKDDIQFWFAKAFRSLKRAENDMAKIIVEKMSGYINVCLSLKTIQQVLGRDTGGKISSFFKATTPKVAETDVNIQDIDESLTPLREYFEKNLKTLFENLEDSVFQMVILKIWKEVLTTMENLLIPPLSDELSTMKPLDEMEIHVIFKWLELLKIFFNGGEDGDAVAIEDLESSKYHELLFIRANYEKDSQTLIDEYINAKSSKSNKSRATARNKSLIQSRNLGTIRQRKAEKKRTARDVPQLEATLRLLRMRPGKNVREFIKQEMDTKSGSGQVNSSIQKRPTVSVRQQSGRQQYQFELPENK